MLNAAKELDLVIIDFRTMNDLTLIFSDVKVGVAIMDGKQQYS